MAWVKLDDQFHSHPKVGELGGLALPAIGLHVVALCWSNAHLTDGRIPTAMVPRLAGNVTDLFGKNEPELLALALVNAGLWDDADEAYQIHDYLEFQPSREKVMAEREAARTRMARARSADVRPNIARSSREVQQPRTRPVPVPVIPNGTKTPKPPAGVVRFTEVWNENRGPLPRLLKAPTGKAHWDLINRAVAYVGEWNELAKAIRACSQDDHYRENKYGWEAFCRHVSRWAGHDESSLEDQIRAQLAGAK